MRLCYLANPRSPHTRRWLEYFVRQGHEVHLLTFYTNFSPLAGVRSHQILPHFLSKVQRGRGWLALLFLGRIRRLIQTINPDVLHAHYIGFYGWLAALSGFHPFVLTMWGSDVFFAYKRAQKFLSYWLTPFAVRRADLVTAFSKYLLTMARYRVGLAVDGHVTYLLPDLKDFTPSLVTAPLRTQFGLGNCPVIFSPRSFAPVYNIHTIVAAVPYVLERIPEARFVFLAKTAPAHETYRTRIQQMVVNMNVESAVRYVREVPHSEMGHLYQLADVVVSVALSEGFPATVFEAMACGTPLVVGKIPQLEEIITAGQNALAVPVEDPEQVAGAIIRLLEDEPLRQSIVEANLALVKAYGDFDAQMRKMERLYEEVALPAI